MHFDSETSLSICGMFVVCKNVIGSLQVFRFTKNGAVYACGVHKHSLERKRVIVCLATGVQLKSMDQLGF